MLPFLLSLLIADYIQWLLLPSREAQTLYILVSTAGGHNPCKILIRRKRIKLVEKVLVDWC